jgi:hypothetical protein
MARLPNFLIIGAQKAGTSWLHQKLRLHPEIFLAPEKDQAFFCWQEGPHVVSFEHYKQGFENATESQVTGEVTAAYFWTESGSQWGAKPAGYNPDVPKRVLDTLGPETRFILSLRDPVDRAVSAYLHHLATGDLDPSISLLDAGAFSGLIDIGFYAAHLRNWLQHFPLQQILVLIYEKDIVQHQRETLGRVFNFLDVDASWKVPEPEQVVFLGRERVWQDDEVWVPFDSHPNAPGHDQKNIEGRNLCRRVDRSTIHQLREIYARDKLELQNLLGIDLDSSWT